MKRTKHDFWHKLADKKYHHFVAILEENGMISYYVDGALTETVEDKTFAGTNTVYFDKALTATEVADLYACR